MSTEKRCCECRQWKSREAFNRDRSAPDGLQDKCRPCHREAVRESRRRNPESHASYQRRWRQRNRRVTAAHAAIKIAIRRGDLTRPETCEGCGLPGDVHAHHDDYDRPLEVEWLCPPCHRERHGQEVRDAA